MKRTIRAAANFHAMSIHAFALFGATVLAALASPSPLPFPSSSPEPSAGGFCGTALVSPLVIVDSKTANPGQTFTFSIKSLDDPHHRFPTLATGQTGYGLVSVVRHARAGGDPGLLVLETRYVIGSDGAHVPISLVRSVNGLFMGKTRNSPAALSLIPYVGYVTGTYDALHKGTDVATGPGDTLLVMLGDDPVAGTCTIPTPAPTVLPTPSPSPAASGHPQAMATATPSASST